jgi:hypothetical protein
MTGRETWMNWKAVDAWFALLVRSCKVEIILLAFAKVGQFSPYKRTGMISGTL